MGISADTPVTRSVKGISLKTALQLILKNLSLTYLIRNGLLQITTPEEAEQQLETKIYPVGDLVLPEGAPDDAEADFDSLIDLITSTIKPTSWDEVGGPGSISQFANRMCLVVSQTMDVHEEIEDLFTQIRRVDRILGSTAAHFPRKPRRKRRTATAG